MYVQCARVMGIRVAQPAVIIIPNDRTESYLQAIRSRLSPQARALMLGYGVDGNGFGSWL